MTRPSQRQTSTVRYCRRFRGFISLRPMGPPPAGFLIEPLFVPFDTIPAKEVLLIVRIDELDHVIGFTIAPFATMNFCVFYSHHWSSPRLHDSESAIPAFRSSA